MATCETSVLKAIASPASETSDVERVVMCQNPTLPKSKKYKETQYSTVKTRNGVKSVPFLGLPCGIHTVRFYNDKGEMTVKVKTWLSMYGYAWCVL